MAKAINYGFTGDCAAALAAWPVSKAGPKVTQGQLDLAASLLKRHGTGKMLGLAMTLRDTGATMNQIMVATGDTQLNVLRDLVAAGKVSMVEMPGTGRRKVYKVSIGKAAAKRPAKAAGKAAKAAPAAGKGKRPAKAAAPAGKAAKAAGKGKAAKAAPAPAAPATA